MDYLNVIDEIKLLENIEKKSIENYGNLLNEMYSFCIFSSNGDISYKNDKFVQNLDSFVKDEKIYSFFSKESFKRLLKELDFNEEWLGQIKIKDKNKKLYVMNCSIKKDFLESKEIYTFLASEILSLNS